MITRIYHHARCNDSVVVNLLNVSLVFQNHKSNPQANIYPDDICIREKSGKTYTVDGVTLEEVQQHIEEAYAYHYEMLRNTSSQANATNDSSLNLDVE